MYIYEEYASRIGFSDNLIKYHEKSVVFFYGLPHIILTIKKTSGESRPSKFVFNKIQHAENQKISSNEVEWDEYENYINVNIRGAGGAIEEGQDVFLFSWEIFLQNNQSYFCNRFSQKLLYPSVDFSLEKNQRINSINSIVSLLDSKIYNIWVQFQNNKYSYWLAKIINEKTC